ncbi:FUSC family protein [Actinophytocola oryzae]|nr:aromatic acid exporter family protein [Actinophytocola oryzae]
MTRGRRIPGLRTGKTTLAAMLSYLAADTIGTSDRPVLAPLTALLVIQVTMYDTVRQSVQRVASVLAGVLVAVGVAALVGLSWWSLGAVVAVTLILGRLMRLGPQLLEVPISAMLVLAVGGDRDVADVRVWETLIGAAVGVLVNLMIAPPLYLRPAGEAVRDLADRIAAFSRDLADVLRKGWSRADADHWLAEVRATDAVERADRVLARAEEGARLNPRAGQTRREQPQLRTALTGLERCQLSLRELCRALLDRVYYVPDEAGAYTPEQRRALADLLDTAADAVSSFDDRDRLKGLLAELVARRDGLVELLMVDPLADAAAWQQHGALLSAVDRLRVEIEASAREPDGPWRPTPLTDRQRRAVRRFTANRRRGRRD